MKWSRSLSARVAAAGALALMLAAPVSAAPIARISAVVESGVSPAGMVRQALPRESSTRVTPVMESGMELKSLVVPKGMPPSCER